MNTLNSWTGVGSNAGANRNAQSSVSRDGPVISILLPSSRLSVNGGVIPVNSGGVAVNRGGNAAATPIVVRTNLGRSGTANVGTGGPLSYAMAAQAGINASHFSDYNLHPYEGPLVYSRPSRRRGGAVDLSDRVRGAPTPQQQTDTQPLTHQSEQEADSLVWDMFANLSEHQASAITTAFTMTVDARESSCHLYSTMNNFLRLIDLARILYGQEVMDMILLSRYEVGVEALRRRSVEFLRRLAEHQQKKKQTEEQPGLEAESVNSSVMPIFAPPNEPFLEPGTSFARINEPMTYPLPSEQSGSHFYMGWNENGESGPNAIQHGARK